MKRYFKIFLLTFFILLVILLMLQIYPFGDKTLIVSDLRDQYLVFINYLKYAFNGNGLLYTLSGSLGESFIPLASYYLMSIFNIITLPFKGDLMPLVLTFIILIKISLSSVTMLYFLDKKYDRKIINYIFAISYGLMSYNMAFYFHIMWLDAIILLPLVALGIENIFEKHSIKLYLISLSLTIISNYYIGLIVCVFSVIYFIYYYLINNKKKYDYKKIIVKYVISSILSGMISMFILLPIIFSLGSSKALVGGDLAIVGKSFNSIEILSKTLNLSYDSSSIWHGGPNIFVGSLIIILIISYFMNKKIKNKNKIITAVLLFLLFLVCRIHFLDLLFHGLSEPNCFDFRQAFIISFFLILIGYEGLKNFKKFDKQKYLLIGIFIFHLVVYLFNISYFSGLRSLFLLFSFLVFVLFIYLVSKKNYKILFIIVILDLIINAVNILSTITTFEKNASDIPCFQNYYLDNSNIINKIKESDNSFYRMEKDYHHTNNINDSMMFNYNGISHFDSTSNANTEKLLENLGFRRVVSRAFYDKGSTRAVDMLLGIKYVLSSESHFDYKKLYMMNDINVLQNPNYISLAFLYNSAESINYTDNVFENLNTLFANLTGVNDLYKSTDYAINYSDIKIEGNTYYKDGDCAYISYSFTPKAKENYYLYFKDNLIREDYKKADILINNHFVTEYFTKYNYGMINLGTFNKPVTITIVLNDDYITFEDGLLYYEDSDLFNEIHDKLNNNSKVTYDSKLRININNADNKYVLLAIPYEEGWNIVVDNKKVDYYNYGGFISFPLDIGSHEITLDYVPKGLTMGIIISVISIGISGIMIYKEKYEKKN